MLTEINPRVRPHRSEQEKEQRPQVFAVPIVGHGNETEREKQRKERGGVPRRERQPIVHAYAIGQRQRDIGHILGKPRQGAGCADEVLDRLHHRGRQQHIARQKHRPPRAIQQEQCYHRVWQPVNEVGIAWQHRVQKRGVVVAEAEVECAFRDAKQGYPQRSQEQQRGYEERTNVGDP